MLTPEQFNEVRDASLVTAFASITGCLSYLVQVYEGKQFSWIGFALHFMVSAVAGFITYLMLHSWSTPADLAGALCGIAGWMGTRMMRIFEILAYRRYGIDPTVTKPTQETKEGDK